MHARTGIWGMLLFCVLVGVVMTSFTGFLNNKLKVPALVLTIALVFVYEALPRVIFPSGVKIRLSMTTLAAAPYIFIVLAVLFVVFYLIYTKSTHGHNLKALGGNQDIAKAAARRFPCGPPSTQMKRGIMKQAESGRPMPAKGFRAADKIILS